MTRVPSTAEMRQPRSDERGWGHAKRLESSLLLSSQTSHHPQAHWLPMCQPQGAFYCARGG
eukprot:1704557-Pyramimonas_sp.AAC.1